MSCDGIRQAQIRYGKFPFFCLFFSLELGRIPEGWKRVAIVTLTPKLGRSRRDTTSITSTQKRDGTKRHFDREEGQGQEFRCSGSGYCLLFPTSISNFMSDFQ